MIVNIRGTGGAGKSMIVREMMRRCVTRTSEFIAGRRQPIGYRCVTPAGRTLYVPGHYETACGGCDTIAKPDDVYALVTREAALGSDVLFEGIIVQDDTRRCLALAAECPLHVIALQVPMGMCLASIQVRRDARGEARPLNPKNTVNRQKRLEGTMRKLLTIGVAAMWLTREEAMETVARLLGLGGEASAVETDSAETLFELRA